MIRMLPRVELSGLISFAFSIHLDLQKTLS